MQGPAPHGVQGKARNPAPSGTDGLFTKPSKLISKKSPNRDQE